jgi:hypothetical protein
MKNIEVVNGEWSMVNDEKAKVKIQKSKGEMILNNSNHKKRMMIKLFIIHYSPLTIHHFTNLRTKKN